MDIFALGVGHHKAPVAIREKLQGRDLTGEDLWPLLSDGTISEILPISTCNRLELVGLTEDPQKARLALNEKLSILSGLSLENLSPYLHFYLNREAVSYLFRIAAGLDSLILGEPQILGQVKEAYRQASQLKWVGPIVGKLFHKSFQTAKRVRSETGLSLGSVSVAAAAVEEAASALAPWGGFSQTKALILGAGEMASLLAAHLSARGLKSLTILSRSPERAGELALRHGANSGSLDSLSEAIKECHLVMGAAGGGEPIVKKSFLLDASPSSAPGQRPLFLFDLGVPRNIEEEVGNIPGLCLRNLDDFAASVDQNKNLRQKEAARAESIIEGEVDKFQEWLSALSTRPTLRALSQKAEEARLLELERTLSRHSFSSEQTEALEAMTKALVRRLMHHPLTYAKACHRHGRARGQLGLIRRMFGLDE
jgi:glutamyl-tRNA reductase